ncbi:PerC family transcriptional regulator [Erwinia persicina]|uniref:PerC family transcriptional regulator n=1 Tax=Erwinia persicina TaxID=55211 RepID=UPI0021032D45|nr:PerC family transcriptional regulator [Erwinia persicina]MCQ4105187.1 PerC family transcriptional regulator [Erwinia persicina]UTX11399.1 PerC family transcriptional regulator [Erwinia persicina]
MSMNIREMAIEFVRNNPGCTSTQIANGAGIPKRLIQPLMSELYVEEIVTRYALKAHPFYYRMPLESERVSLGVKYDMHRGRAIELEERGLWRRAAREWLLAMDATKNDEARDKAAARREHCISHGHVGISYDTPGIGVVSVPEIDHWRDW